MTGSAKAFGFRDISVEIRYVLIVTGLITGLVLILSFFDSLSMNLSPVCISILNDGVECSLCGMTRSFVAISNFDFSSAWTLNKGGIILYTLFLINTVYAFAQLRTGLTKLKRKR